VGCIVYVGLLFGGKSAYPLGPSVSLGHGAHPFAFGECVLLAVWSCGDFDGATQVGLQCLRHRMWLLAGWI
jgi:hypothetical protein